MQYSKGSLKCAEWMGIITSHDLLAMCLVIQPRMLLPSFAARAHCWLMFSLLPVSPAAQPAGLQPVLLHRVFPSQVQDFCLFLWNFMISYQPNPLACLGPFDWWPCSWWCLTGLRSLVSLGNLMRAHFIASSWLLIDVKQNRSQYRPMQYSTCYKPPGWGQPINRYLLKPTIQPFFYPWHQFVITLKKKIFFY